MNSYIKYFGEDEARHVVEEAFAIIDLDGNGEIDFFEFLTVTADKNKLLDKDHL